MSWSAWPTAGPPLPGVVAAPAMASMMPGAVNSAPNVLPPATGAAIPAGMQYSPEQWAQMQQQNWQQWAQWQQQYQQWHQQYGAEYQKSMNALAVSAPPAATNTAVPPPPPNENKPPPPPPPDDSVQANQYTTMPPKMGAGYTTAPPNQHYTTGPPPNFRQQQQPQNQWQNAGNKRPLAQGDEYDGGKRQMVDNQGQWNKPTQPPPKATTGQSWQSQPPPSSQTHAQKVLNLEELTVAEKKFDKEFAAWEAQFNKWKDQNANHPDKTQYMEYEKKWESWRNSLLDRREQMRKKRVALQASMAISAPTSKPAPPAIQPQQSFNQPPPTQPISKIQTPAVDIFSKPPPTQNNEPLAFKPPKGYPGEEAHEQDAGADFLKSSTSASGGIPGLDLVKEGQNQELPGDEADDMPVVEDAAAPGPAKGPDLDAISKGINSILGDSKLMNMLSIVSKNQSFSVGNITTAPPKMLDQPPPPPRQPAPKSNAPPIPSLLSMPLTRPPVEPPKQNYDDYSDEYGPGQREDVNNFDDQTRMSFSNGPNDQDMDYGNNFNIPPPAIGPRSRTDSVNRGDNLNDGFNRGDTRNNSFNRGDNLSDGFNRGDNLNDVFNRGDNRNDGFKRGDNRNDGFNHGDNRNEGFNRGDNRNDGFNRGDNRNDGFNRGDNRNNFGGNFNDNGRDKFNRVDSFEGPSGNRPGFNKTGNNDKHSGGIGRGFNQNDSFKNKNDNFNNRGDNFNNRGGKFDRPNDYDDYGEDYDDRFDDTTYDDDHYNEEYENQNFNDRRGFENEKGFGDNYNEEGWNEEDEYEKYHSMFNEGDQPPVAAPMAPVPVVPVMPPPVPPPPVAAPPVDEGPLFVPQVVVDYEHKSLKEPEPEVCLEPIHMFDYRHKPVNRIPYPQRPIWLQGALRNTRQFDPLGGGRFGGPDRQFDPLGPVMLIRPNDDKFRDYRDRQGNDDKFRDYRDRPGNDDKFRDYRDRPGNDDKFKDYRDRAGTDDKFRDYRDKPANDEKYRDSRDRPANDDKFRDYRDRPSDDKYGNNRDKYVDNKFERRQERDRDQGRDKERNRYDNSPKNRDREVRDKGRDNPDRSNKQASYSEKLDLEELSDDEWNDDDTDKKGSLKFSPPKRNVHAGSLNMALAANPSNSSVNTAVNQNVTLEDLINVPGRYKRPQRIVIILRGPPGSGKTYLARLIKDREVENGGSAPRILSLDDYFMIEHEKEIMEDGKPVRIKEMVYEYESEMEESYRQSLTKAFKKTVTDGYFSFIVVDNVNQKVKYFGEMWSYAKQNGFQVYICQMDLDPQLCTRRNIHNRSQSDIEDCIAGWEPTPSHHPLVDATNFMQSCGSITEVEMEEVDQSQDEREDAVEDQARSKWDTFDCSVNNLARLDGVNKPLRPSRTMEEYLQLGDEWEEPSEPTKPGQKRVRWADLEEQKQQKKIKAIGFVVGQTDWKRMMDPSYGESALTQTKYIERVRRS